MKNEVLDRIWEDIQTMREKTIELSKMIDRTQRFIEDIENNNTHND